MRTFTTALALAGAMGIAAPSMASAHGNRFFLTVEAGASYAPNDPYENELTVGAEGGIGAYWALSPQLALGKRFDLLVLPADETASDDDYGYGSLMAAARLRPFADPMSVRRSTGFFVEGAIGPAIAEAELRLAFAGAIGYLFDVGSLAIGPQARYTQVIEGDRFNDRDARILTGGIVFTFFDDPARPQVAQRVIDLGEPEPEAAKVEEPAEPVPEPELEERIVFVEDEAVIDERVFFDFDRAQLRPSGREVLRQVAELYRQDGESWARLRVMGHADERGPATYNVDLSRRRADAVRHYLITQGMPATILDVEAYGESRPLIEDATTEQQYQMNRRVAFQIVRGE